MWNNSLIIGKNFRNLACPLLASCSNYLSQQTRNTFILKRKWPPGLTKKNSSRKPVLRGRHYVYELVEDTRIRKKPDMELILTAYVDGVGKKGDRISMRPNMAYTRLLLPGLAVYPTPENSAKYEILKESSEDLFSSPYVERTMNLLSRRTIAVHLSSHNPWVLERWHVKTAFRIAGFHMQDESITLPDKPISGPDFSIEGKEFYVTVVINNKEQVKVRCRIFHLSDYNSLSNINVDFYKTSAEPIFPEDKPILDAMPTYFEKSKKSHI